MKARDRVKGSRSKRATAEASVPAARDEIDLDAATNEPLAPTEARSAPAAPPRRLPSPDGPAPLPPAAIPFRSVHSFADTDSPGELTADRTLRSGCYLARLTPLPESPNTV